MREARCVAGLGHVSFRNLRRSQHLRNNTFFWPIDLVSCSTVTSMKRKTRAALIGVVATVGVAIVGFFALPAFLGFDAKGPVELTIGDRAAESIASIFEEPNTTTAQTNAVSEQDGAEAGDDSAAIALVGGVWSIAGDSVAGYRVFKDFVGASEFEAVGRTSTIFGELEIEGTTVTRAQFSVDIASIRSDDEGRDQQFRGPILEAAAFPFANFTLTSPIDLGDEPKNGELVTVDVTGEITLKGVTRTVEFPLTARLVGDEVQVAGSIEVVFSNFDIEPPRTPVIVVRDTGVIEFSLFFEQNQTL